MHASVESGMSQLGQVLMANIVNAGVPVAKGFNDKVKKVLDERRHLIRSTGPMC